MGEKKKGAKKEESAEKKKIADKRVSDQKTLDSQIVPLIEKVSLLKDYMKSRFSLRKGQYPHDLKF
jgi:large subunit ribosomal protein L6e